MSTFWAREDRTPWESRSHEKREWKRGAAQKMAKSRWPGCECGAEGEQVEGLIMPHCSPKSVQGILEAGGRGQPSQVARSALFSEKYFTSQLS